MENLKAFQDTVFAPLNAFTAYMTAMGNTASEFQGKARDSMVQGIAHLQAQRATFQQNVERLHKLEAEAWDQTSQEVAQAWSTFDNWVSDATGFFDSERDAFIGRTDEQLKFWAEYVENSSEQALKIFEEQNENFNSAADQWRSAQDEALNRFRERSVSGQSATASGNGSAQTAKDTPAPETTKKRANATAAKS